MSENWNALTAHQKIEAIHDDLTTITSCMMELTDIVSKSAPAQTNEKLKEITKRLRALGPPQMQRKMSTLTGFPPARKD
jgi:hypothetical protein